QSNSRIVGRQPLSANVERPLCQQTRILVLLLSGHGQREVIETVRHVEIVGAVRPLPDAKRAFLQRRGVAILAAVLEYRAEPGETRGDAGIFGTEGLLTDRQRAASQRLGGLVTSHFVVDVRELEHEARVEE